VVITVAAESRPPLLLLAKEHATNGALSRPVSLVAGAPGTDWRSSVTQWAGRHAEASWFPWALAAIGFLDPFTLCGFLLTPLLSLALMASDLCRALLLCTASSMGCLAGNYVFTLFIGRLGVSSKLTDTPQLAAARELLQRHGIIAGLFNTLFPLPTTPLIVAAQAADANVAGIILTMALGRSVRYAVLAATILSSRSLYRSVSSQK